MLYEVEKVYHHYATPETIAQKINLEIPEPKKRVKLNASRRDSGIGYSSEENSPSQSPLPTTEIKFKLPETPETPKKIERQSRSTSRRSISTLQRSTSLMTFPRSCSRSNLSCFVDDDKNKVYTGKEILQKNISKPPTPQKSETSRSSLSIFRKKSLKETKEEIPKLRKLKNLSPPPSGFKYRCRVLYDFDGNDLDPNFYPGADSGWYQSYSSGINTDLTEVSLKSMTTLEPQSLLECLTENLFKWRKECIRVREGDYVFSKSNTSKDSWIEIMYQGQLGHIPFKFIEFLD